MADHYHDPITKPPLQNDPDNPSGKPSDHLIVLWRPLSCFVKMKPREYRTVFFRPIPESGLSSFNAWLNLHSWEYLCSIKDINMKTRYFHDLILHKVDEIFPMKSLRVSKDDQPWITQDIKSLDRQRKREFFKNYKSSKWHKLNEKYISSIKKAKVLYAKNIVGDLKTSNPAKWYSKVKRMTDIHTDKESEHFIEGFVNLDTQAQADAFVDFYACTRNQFESVKEEDFSEIITCDVRQNVAGLLTTPDQIESIILGMNKKSACIPGDIPFKIVHFFASHFAKPLCNIFNSIFIEGKYPDIWKVDCGVYNTSK